MRSRRRHRQDACLSCRLCSVADEPSRTDETAYRYFHFRRCFAGRYYQRLYIDNAQFLERSIALDQQLREKKKFLSKRTTDNSFERVLFQTRSIQQQLGSSPPLETFDGTIFTKLVNRVQVSPTTIEFKFMNGMTLSEKRSSL